MDEAFYARYNELQERHWWFQGRKRIVLSQIRRAIQRPVGLAADFGCGTGTLLADLESFGRVVGFDTDHQAVNFCHARGHRYVQHLPEGERMPLASGSVDLLTCLDVLEHIDDDDRAISEFRRVVAPSGLALFSVPAFPILWGLQDEVSHHHRRYRADGLRAKLTRGGFSPIKISYFNTFLFPPIAAVRLGRRLLPSRGVQGQDASDFDLGRQWMDRSLGRVFGSEEVLLRHCNFPFGVSLLALAN